MKTKSTLFCLLFAICINTSITTYAQVNVQDSLALVDLYNSTDGTGWYDNTNWLTGPVNIWYGITVSNQRVTEVRLYENNLRGKIPSSLGNLKKLTWLDLSSNHLSGSIPSELGNLSNLFFLNLYDNQLSGSIPPELGNLLNLTHLELSANQLSGNIPPQLGNLSNLISLSLGSNQLSGNIPPELGNFSNLNIFGLAIAMQDNKLVCRCSIIFNNQLKLFKPSPNANRYSFIVRTKSRLWHRTCLLLSKLYQ